MVIFKGISIISKFYKVESDAERWGCKGRIKVWPNILTKFYCCYYRYYTNTYHLYPAKISADFKIVLKSADKKLADLDKNHVKFFGREKSQEILCFISNFANHNVSGP